MKRELKYQSVETRKQNKTKSIKSEHKANRENNVLNFVFFSK